MKRNTSSSSYIGHRFPPMIISHCVWLYFRFSLSFRDVEEFMAVCGVRLTYETIRQYVPRVIITNKLTSYAARKEIMPHAEHRQDKGLNNRAENSHQSTRQRERTMRHFTSPSHAQ